MIAKVAAIEENVAKIVVRGYTVQDQTSDTVQSKKRVKHPGWRLAFGALLLFLGIKSLFFPDPNMPIELQYSNLTQKVSGDFVQVVLCLVGIWLILAGANLMRQNRTK
jgi:uncharacterized membrane protein HdeD (DUF308 family)